MLPTSLPELPKPYRAAGKRPKPMFQNLTCYRKNRTNALSALRVHFEGNIRGVTALHSFVVALQNPYIAQYSLIVALYKEPSFSIVNIFSLLVITWQGGGVTTSKFVRKFVLSILYLPIATRSRNKSNRPQLFSSEVFKENIRNWENMLFPY